MNQAHSCSIKCRTLNMGFFHSCVFLHGVQSKNIALIIYIFRKWQYYETIGEIASLVNSRSWIKIPTLSGDGLLRSRRGLSCKHILSSTIASLKMQQNFICIDCSVTKVAILRKINVKLRFSKNLESFRLFNHGEIFYWCLEQKCCLSYLFLGSDRKAAVLWLDRVQQNRSWTQILAACLKSDDVAVVALLNSRLRWEYSYRLIFDSNRGLQNFV